MALSSSTQEGSSLSQQLTPPDDDMFPPQCAYYFPDNHPSLFVSFLGAGHQGAAILVRSVLDGKLYVRKRKREFAGAFYAIDNETEHAIPHPNIPKLISQTRLPYPPIKWRTRGRGIRIRQPTTDLWSYANGGDLQDLVDRYKELKTPLPPVLIFRLIYQLLDAAIHIHNHDIAHGDILAPNVFVHWPSVPEHTIPDLATCSEAAESSSDSSNPSASSTSSTSSITATLPQFLLGDFGVSYKLPPTDEARKFHRVQDTSQAVYGDISSIAGVVAYAMTGEHSETAPQLTDISRDWYTSSGETGKWLVICFDNLAKLTSILQRYAVSRERDGVMFCTVVGALIKDLETGMDECLKGMDKKEDVFANVRPRVLEKDRRVAMVWSKELLLAKKCRPPGPWCIAEVDGWTGALRGVELGTKYCVNEAMVTRKDGQEMECGEVWQDGDIVCG